MSVAVEETAWISISSVGSAVVAVVDVVTVVDVVAVVNMFPLVDVVAVVGVVCVAMIPFMLGGKIWIECVRGCQRRWLLVVMVGEEAYCLRRV